MKALPWWLFAYVFAASVIVMIFFGLIIAQVFGACLFLSTSFIRSRLERKR